MNEMNNQSPGIVSSSLRDLWIELELGSAARPAAGGVSSAPRSSSSSGSGSNGAGYGLGLVAPDRFSRERILRIMHELCEKDAERNNR